MRIAACIIVKDDTELSILTKAVASVSPYVDSVHITANGKSVSGIESYCKENNFDYSFLPWNKDFSAQRNFNFARAPKDTDFILWIDSDDILIGGEYLREVAEVCLKKGWKALLLEYWYGCVFDGEPTYENLIEVELYHSRERLINPNVITWNKRIHETPAPKDGVEYNYSKIIHLPHKPDSKYPVAVMHTGADRYMSKKRVDDKMARNREMLELELEGERKIGQPDPRTMLYLLKIYAEMSDKESQDKGIALGEEYLTCSGWDLERGEALLYMAQIKGKQSDDQQAALYMHEALREYPYNPMFYLLLAEAYANQEKWDRAEFYLNFGLNMDIDKGHGQTNLIQLKLLATQLLLQIEFKVRRSVSKSLMLAKTLFELDPSEETQGTVNYLTELNEKNEACKNIDNFTKYLVSTHQEEAVFPLLESLPPEIKVYPFAQKLMLRYGTPKKWGEKEICYFANFGRTHVEQWSPKNLEKGLGGSETAVIQLAKEWMKLGYKVTVYGDPGKEEGEHDGVTYLPFYKFNPRDYFNIFIQWRNNSLAGNIICKQFYVDLHDVWSDEAYKTNIHSINKLMVKSKAHRILGQNIPDSKFKIISNGI